MNTKLYAGILKEYDSHHQSPSVFSKNSQENILITNETLARACLADFRLSTLTPSVPGQMTTTTAGGTPLHMALEMLNPGKFGKTNSRPTQPADIYALGMVIYEVLTGFYPFREQFARYQLVFLVVSSSRPTKPDNAEEIGFWNGTWELVKECWREKSTKRPTVARVLAHLARVSESSEVQLRPMHAWRRIYKQ